MEHGELTRDEVDSHRDTEAQRFIGATAPEHGNRRGEGRLRRMRRCQPPD